MEEKEVKTERPRAEGRQNLLNLIIAETFVRHAGLSEEEYLEKIGFKDKGLTEEQAVRYAMFNVCMELTNTMIKAQTSFNLTKNLFKTLVNGESLTENEEKGETK